MEMTPAAILARARSDEGQKAIRYTLTSVVSVAVTAVLLTFFHAVLDWSATVANLVACSIAAVPSYVLNRWWAWGKRGRSHLWKEVVPFWTLALIGLGFSTWAADWAEGRWHGRTIYVTAASMAAFGVLWVVKFVVFNELLFKHHEQDMPPALDGRTGIPT